MRYNVNYNQYGLLKYNAEHPNKQIDLVDAILLNWLERTIKEWKDLESKKIGQQTFYWLAYDKFLNELPSLGIKTKDGIAKRLNKRLLKYGLIKKFVDKGNETKTYFRVTTLGRQTVSTRTTDRSTPGRPTGNPSDGRPNNNTTKDNYTKDERELSHFEFLKVKYPNDYIKWENEFKKQIYNLKEFIEAFNGQMEIDNFYKNKQLLPRFKKYARHWIKNQKKNERPEPKPVYLRKFT